MGAIAYHLPRIEVCHLGRGWRWGDIGPGIGGHWVSVDCASVERGSSGKFWQTSGFREWGCVRTRRRREPFWGALFGFGLSSPIAIEFVVELQVEIVQGGLQSGVQHRRRVGGKGFNRGCAHGSELLLPGDDGVNFCERGGKRMVFEA